MIVDGLERRKLQKTLEKELLGRWQSRICETTECPNKTKTKMKYKGLTRE